MPFQFMTLRIDVKAAQALRAVEEDLAYREQEAGAKAREAEEACGACFDDYSEGQWCDDCVEYDKQSRLEKKYREARGHAADLAYAYETEDW